MRSPVTVLFIIGHLVLAIIGAWKHSVFLIFLCGGSVAAYLIANLVALCRDKRQ